MFVGVGASRVRDLFDRLGDRLGIALRSVQYRAQMHELLEEPRRQAEELRAAVEAVIRDHRESRIAMPEAETPPEE